MGNKIIYLFLLAVSAFFLVIANVRVWTTDQEPLPASKQQTKVQPAAKQFIKKSPQPSASYESVVADNLFTRERKEIIKKVVPEEASESETTAATEAEAATEPEPEITKVTVEGTTIILHGIILLGDMKKALITNPKRKEDEKENIWVQIDDKLANLSVNDILSDRIVLGDGKKKFIILLHDESKQKKQETQRRSVRPTVVSTAPVPKPTVKKEAAGKPDEDGYIMVRTPFGMVRKKK